METVLGCEKWSIVGLCFWFLVCSVCHLVCDSFETLAFLFLFGVLCLFCFAVFDLQLSNLLLRIAVKTATNRFIGFTVS